MLRLGLIVFVAFLNYVHAQVEPGYQPMVAFKCDYPAMFLTEDGWVKDPRTDCVDDAEDVLEFCKKVFPDMDVRNVVESAQLQVVNNWCKVGESNCDKSFTVRPYRCLVGPFQSDALLVPAGCIFDHVHESHVCKSFSEWNATAVQSCNLKNRVSRSFAVLQPCEGLVSSFDGVEFVCCMDDLEVPPANHVIPVSTSSSPVVVEDDKEASVVEDDDKTSSAYFKFMHESDTASELSEEHADFVAAKAELREQHQASRQMLAEDWKRVSQRVAQLNLSDPQSAEKMNREATARFENAAHDMDAESRAEKLQLDAKHQQHVEAILDERKQDTLQAYYEAVAEQKQDPEKILQTLKQYIKAEQKDRQRLANRFHHLLQTDPELLTSVKHSMALRLRKISQNIQQAVDLLSQVTVDEDKIRNEIDDFMATFSPLDRSVMLILNDDKDLEAKPIEQAEVQEPRNVQEDKLQQDESEFKPDVVEDKETELDNSAEKKQPELTEPEVIKNSDEEDDDEDEDDEENDEESKEMDAYIKEGDHMSESELDQQETRPFVKPLYKSTHTSAGLIALTVGGCIVLIGLIFASVFVASRRAGRGPAFSSVSQSVPLEDVHVTNMQVTGYENPTYKFFEEKGSNNA